MKKGNVAIVKVEEGIQSAVYQGIDLIGGFKVSDSQSVVIKPNLCQRRPPETGSTTDVRVVEAIVNYLNERSKCSVRVVESDSYARDCIKAFEKLGYGSLERLGDVRLVNLSSEGTMKRDISGRFFQEIEIPETLSRYDHFVTVPKLKTSIMQRMSGALKNQFGCLPAKEKRLYHPFLNEVLFDLNTVFKPGLCIVDGIVGMEGCGPTDGYPKGTNILIIGKDPVAVDAVSCTVMGIDPVNVPHLRFAFENSLGEMRMENIDLLNVPLKEVKDTFAFVPEKAYRQMKLGLELGRYPPPLRNLGILLFIYGNFKAGEKSLVRVRKHRREGKPSKWNMLKKALWTTRWNV